MKLVLHVGSGKTGTTSIQTSLRNASSVLLRRGVLYPLIDRRKDHNLLAVPFKRSVSRRIAHRFGSDKAAGDAAMRHFRVVGKLVQEHRPHTLVLSAEFLFREIDASGFMRQLHASAPGIKDVQIAAYLRQPSGYYLSRMQQRLKSSPDLLEPDRVDLAGATSQWSTLGQLTLREFARAQLVDSDAVRDFWYHFLPGEPCPYAAGSLRENTGLSAESMCLLRHYHLGVWPTDGPGMLANADLLVRRLQKVEASGDLGLTKPSLHEDISGYLDAPCKDLTYLREVHGFEFAALAGGGASSDGAQMPDRAFDTIGAVMTFSPEKLSRLRNRLAAGWCVPGTRTWRQNRHLSALQLRDDI